MAEQIAQAATTFQQQRTGHRAEIGERGARRRHAGGHAARRIVAGRAGDGTSPEGAAKVQEFHRQLFLNASDTLRQEIKRITGMEVREATAEVEPKTGAVVQVFTSGTMVQVFLLSGKCRPEAFRRSLTAL
jgi:hypothetical protein